MDYVTFDKLCKANGTSATALALKLGLSKGNTTSWRKGGNPSADILIKIADELNCTVDVLLGRGTSNPIYSDEDGKALYSAFIQLSDKDKAKVIERAETLAELAAERVAKERAAEQSQKEAQIDEPAADEQPEVTDSDPNQRSIKILHSFFKVSAGRGVDLSGDNEWEEIEIPDTRTARKADYALTIQGNSMEPIYYDGDIVLVKKQDGVDIGQIGIFVLDGFGFIKKFYGDRLISLNEEYTDIMLADYSDCYCDGRVIGRV